jgi:hypothetical protein
MHVMRGLVMRMWPLRQNIPTEMRFIHQRRLPRHLPRRCISATAMRYLQQLAMPPIKDKQLYSDWNLFKKAKMAPMTVKVLLLKTIIGSVRPVRLQMVQQSFSRAFHPFQRAP